MKCKCEYMRIKSRNMQQPIVGAVRRNVIPAKAGIQNYTNWIPACAGMTERDCFGLNNRPRNDIKSAFTLIEMLIVVSIIAVLATIVISTASHLDTQGKISRTQNTIALLNTALSEFRDYGFTYDAVNANGQYAHLKFPIDCNEHTIFNKSTTETVLRDAIPDITAVVITPNAGLTYDNYWSSTIAMYFLLSKVPQCRQILEKLDPRAVVSCGKIDIAQSGVTTSHPLIYIVDAWGKPLGYKYYNFTSGTTTIDLRTVKTFPVITSAGPDRIFDTADDVRSR